MFPLAKEETPYRAKGKRRSILPFNDQQSDLVEIPLMGLIAAGGPIEAIRDPEPITVPRSMLSRGANHYALKVSGNKYDRRDNGWRYCNCPQQPTVDDGEKAVAYLPDKDAVTLKRFTEIKQNQTSPRQRHNEAVL